MFILKSTHNMEIDGLNFQIRRKDNSISALEIKIIHMQAKITGYEKTYKIRTGYWKDKAGRWRDPKTSHCVKASIVMTAQLRKEAEHAYASRQAQAQQAGALGDDTSIFGRDPFGRTGQV